MVCIVTAWGRHQRIRFIYLYENLPRLFVRLEIEYFYDNQRIDSESASPALEKIMVFDKVYTQAGNDKRKIVGVISKNCFTFFKKAIFAKWRWSASH